MPFPPLTPPRSSTPAPNWRGLLGLQYADILEAVRRRCEDLLLDCLASVLAGSTHRAVKSVAKFARTMWGPATATRGTTSTAV